MKTKCDACEKNCLCHFCLLNDRCKKATEHCREREDCPIDCYTSPAGYQSENRMGRMPDTPDAEGRGDVSTTLPGIIEEEKA